VVFVACATPENRNYSAEAIEARVLDEESGQPLEDVVVVANWLLMRGGLGGRTQIGPLMVLEVVSDAKGRISFPAWGPMPNRTFGFLDHEDPELWFFKPGYRLSRVANYYATDYCTKPSKRKSDWNGKVIRLKRFTDGDAQYAEYIAGFGRTLAANLKWNEHCTIARTPKLAAALDRENGRLEERGFSKGGFTYRQLMPEFLSRCQMPDPAKVLQ
jgi:hypothetical protein